MTTKRKIDYEFLRIEPLIDDECLIDEQLYCCEQRCFGERNVKQRNNDFYNSQKQENEELEKALDDLYGSVKRL